MIWILPAVSAILLALIGGGHFAQKEQLRLQERRLQASDRAVTHARLAERRVEQAAFAASLLGATLEATHSYDAIDIVVERVMNAQPSISTVQIRTDGRVWRSYANGRLGAFPEPAPTQAVPLDVRLAPYGKVGISANEEGIAASQAIHRVGAEVNRFWGEVLVRVSAEELLAGARLEDLEKSGYDHRLVFQEAEGAAPVLLSQTGRASTAGVTHIVALSNGERLMLQVSPTGGERFNPFLFVELALVVVAAILLGFFLHIVLRHPDLFKKDAAAENTADSPLPEAGLDDHLHFLEHMIDTIPLPVLVQNQHGRLVQVNQACERFFGLTQADLLAASAGPLSELLLPALPDRHIDSREARLQLDATRTADVLLQRAVLHDRDGPVRGVVNVLIDLTERQETQRQIERVNRTLAVLSSVNETIVRGREQRPVLERTCEILVEQGGFPLAWFEFDDRGEDAPEVVKGEARDGIAPLRTLLMGCPRRCRPLNDPAGDIDVCRPEDCGNPALLAYLHQRDFGCAIRLSIGTGRGRTGTLVILTAANQLLAASEQKLLGDLANDLSFAMEAISQEELRRQAEDKLKLAAQVFENAAEGIMITEADNRVLMVNKAFSNITGYAPEEILGQNPRLLSSGRHDAAFYRDMWQTLQKRGEWHGEVENRRKDGAFYAEWLTISAVRNDRGEVTNYVAVFTDITSSKQIEERLNFLANYDPLTALPNRILFNDRLEQAIQQARADDTRVAVFFLDLDRFSLINETFGHSAGDTVLQGVSQRLKATLRPGDSASRLGGDEFAVILPALDSIDEAGQVASKVMQALAQPFHIDDRELYTSASIGISLFPEDGDDPETLVKNADSAMYRAMQEGHDSFRYYHQQMNARSSERMAMESDLRRALDRGELAMHYQPFVEAGTGRIVGAEALLRWNRPGSGLVPPAVFVPLLEETGLIVPVGEWILRTACIDNLRWRQQGFSDLFVAVNFSAAQLRGHGVARKLADVLDALGFEPRYLEIELTESMVMHNAEQAIRTLNEFKEIGTLLSVDDFGTGYSSLAYLKRLPLDTLKIDRSFIIDTPHESEANAIVQAIIAMGHSLDLKIIAEGVQEAEQADFLRRLRCDLLQGFHFSRAVDQTQFLALLEKPSWPPHTGDGQPAPLRSERV